MVASRIVAAVFGAACLCLPPGCDRGGEARAEADGPTGRWERRYQDDAGQSYHETLDLRENGTYAKDASGWMADRGRYLIEGDVIAFRSDAEQTLSRDMEFHVDKDGLLLSASKPFPVSETWTRAAYDANFRTVDRAGRALPQSLPALMMSAYGSLVLNWREDAVPTWIRLEELQSGGYKVAFHYFSPSSIQEYLIVMTENDVETSVGDGARAVRAPLPPNFMDLVPVLEIATRDGFTGALKRADLRAYDKYGAVWNIWTGAPTGASYSAETGARITEDVTGYIAQYNADWARAGALWRKRMEQSTPGGKRWYKDVRTARDCHRNAGIWKSDGLGGGWCDGTGRSTY